MDKWSVIKKLDALIALSDHVKIQAEGLRTELVNLYSAAPRKRAKDAEFEEKMKESLFKRRVRINQTRTKKELEKSPGSNGATHTKIHCK